MHFVDNIFPHLARFSREGFPVAIVTLINLEGSSPRPVGAMIGVAGDGRAVGMITGGCAEKAIVEDALECITSGKNKMVRYGAGSPYLDVVLPCGSGIDLVFNVADAANVSDDVNALHGERKTAFIVFENKDHAMRVFEKQPEKQSSYDFIFLYNPDYRIYAFGEGANLVSFCSLADQAGYAVTAFSPDADALEYLSGAKIAGRPIHRNADFSALQFDPYTAVVTLFHEHEWETPILRAALNSDASYIGALGSRKTHAQRLEALATAPATRRPASVIHGPIGLDIGAADPNEIAISIVAEITKMRRRGS